MSKAESTGSVGVCPLCRSREGKLWAKARDVEYRTESQEYSYYRCLPCGVLFIDPMPVDKLKIIYPANYYSFLPENQSAIHKVKIWLDTFLFKKILKRISNEHINILDVGGGSGWLLDVIKKADPRVKRTQIVDFDSSAAALAQERGHHYFCGRFEEFGTEHKFNLILLLNLIEHVENPIAVLEKCKSLLAPGGRILIKTPNFDSLDARLFRHRNWGGYHCPRHWILFTRESFEMAVNNLGFKVDLFQYTQGAPFWTISACAWLADRKFISVTQDKPMFQHPVYPLFNAIFAIFDFLRLSFSSTSQMTFLLYVEGAVIEET
jgi:SAM-dependent methyltransferase